MNHSGFDCCSSSGRLCLRLPDAARLVTRSFSAGSPCDVKYEVNNFRIRSENAEVAAKLVGLPLIATIYHSLLSDI